MFQVLFEYGLIQMEMVQMKTRMTAKGQITIPTILRKKYDIKKGTKIVVIENDNAIILKPITEQYLKRLQGSLKGTGALKTLLNERNIESQ